MVLVGFLCILPWKTLTNDQFLGFFFFFGCMKQSNSFFPHKGDGVSQNFFGLINILTVPGANPGIFISFGPRVSKYANLLSYPWHGLPH